MKTKSRLTKKILNITLVLALLLLSVASAYTQGFISYSYTDVPVSFNSKNAPSYLVGKWKYRIQNLMGDSNSEVFYEIYKNEKGCFVRKNDHILNENYVSPLYYNKIKNEDFISYRNKWGDYITCKVEKITNSQIKLSYIDIKKYNIPRKYGNSGKYLFNTSERFKSFIQNKIYEKSFFIFFKHTLDKVNKITKKCNNPNYSVSKMNTRSFNKNINRWEDWTGLKKVNGVGVKFYSGAMSLKLPSGQIDINGLKHVKDRNNMKVYKGLYVSNGKSAGDVILEIKNHTLSEVSNGYPCNIYFNLSIGTKSSYFQLSYDEKFQISAYANGM